MNIDYFPFVAFVGQAKAKKALMLSLVSNRIRSVLLIGESGTGKSVLTRSVYDLLDKQSMITMPLNTSEEQAIGSLQVESITLCGFKEIETGLLVKADNNILFIDDVNLLSQDVLNYTVDALDSKEVQVARGEVYGTFTSNFKLLATMNPIEGLLSQKSLDRFCLSVRLDTVMDKKLRQDIITKRLEFEEKPSQFVKKYEEETLKLKQKILEAKHRLQTVEVTDAMQELIVSLVLEANCQGHRAEMMLLETAKACAALDSQNHVSIKHIQEAVSFVLAHRMNDTQDNKEEAEANTERGDAEDKLAEEKSTGTQAEGSASNLGVASQESEGKENPLDQPNENYKDEGEFNLETSTESIGNSVNLSLIEPVFKRNNQHENLGSGKRKEKRMSHLEGRHVKNRQAYGKIQDISFLSTIRAAAPFQPYREKGDKAIAIESSDIYKKVREKRTGHTIIFAIDSSGSMGFKKQMRTVKAVIMSLLEEAYVKRDKVGFITFNDNEAHVILEPTRSVVQAEKQLRILPTGGNTPLRKGLKKAYTQLKQYRVKDAEYQPFLVLVTDGRSNEAGNPKENWQSALNLCQKIHDMDVKSMVIDTENGLVKLGLTKELSDALEGSYYKMPKVEKDSMLNLIKKQIR